jgi:sugar O-acyltransferase (sialic acid O-acetyltransferase NeuD family)
MSELIGIYGAGGCGRGIMPIIRDVYATGDCRVLFIDSSLAATVVNGVEVVDWETFCAMPASDRRVCLAIANSAVREKLAKECDARSIKLIEARAQNVIEMDDVEISEGACLSPFVTLTSNIRIGRCFHANLYSYVEHDCVIGDYVTFAPGAKCNGNVHIGDHAYVGSGAVIRQGELGKPLVIGAGAVIGMGAVVTKDVAAGVTVVGNPARPLVKER